MLFRNNNQCTAIEKVIAKKFNRDESARLLQDVRIVRS